MGYCCRVINENLSNEVVVIPVIIIVLVQIGLLWLTIRQFGRNTLSVAIAILGVLNLCPWYTPYETAQPFIFGQPWWLSLWFALSFLLVILLYIRLFRMKGEKGTGDLQALWEKIRSRQVQPEEDSHA